MKKYDHKKIELKVQKEWEKKKIYFASSESKKPKFYSLIEFPYPSAAGLHVGHIRSNTAMDIISRKRRMEGYNVLYPIGWDAFGLPTENYAIKTGIHPTKVTKDNTDIFRKQLKALGFSFDWSREINTTDPAYYKWTQWIFLQFFKKGLAYKAEIPINWCPKDKIGLANEEVIDGKCERCGEVTEKRMKEQWMLAITKYAERLHKDLDLVDYPERVKLSQRNWIGKSEGSLISFQLIVDSKVSFNKKDTNSKLKAKNQKLEAISVFTTRADTIFGATYVVLAPEHPLVAKLLEQVKNKKDVEKYIKDAKKKSEIERTANDKIKTGIELKGIKAINPANNEEIPVWIADYVLPDYGTGAIMAVPAHDERDFEFAKKYNLPIKQVIMPYNLDTNNPPRQGKENTKREVVHIILRNPKNKTILIEFLKGEKWGNFEPKNFIIGGIEEKESLIKTAFREIKEETGYINVKFVEEISFEVQAEFYAAHKDVNRIVHVHTLVFDLINEEKVEIKEDEYFNKDSHEIKWIPYEKVIETVNIPDDKMTWKYFFEGGFAFSEKGILTNSEKFNGLSSLEAQKKITEFVGGKIVTKFKLRDWVFSRQRYWGEPIPIVNCEKCGLVPVPEKDLPLKLPKIKNYKLTETGESPLAGISKWVNTKCPKCKDKAKRETDTMPNWAGSSWYYLRYTDTKNKKEFASKKNLKYWLGSDSKHGGVDWYNGGMEHTTLHLLYSRFWHKFLYDLKLVPTIEPYMKRTSHGMILGEGGVKMSKSLGNVVNPDKIVKIYGADTLRVYEMFIGPFEEAVVWNTDSIIGARRFIEKIWRIGNKKFVTASNLELKKLLHKTIKKVSEDIETMRFNTAISAMMILTTEMEKSDKIDVEDYKKFLKILSPFAPHIAEELWQKIHSAPQGLALGSLKARPFPAESIHFSKWPKWDENLIKDDEMKIAVQVNGKIRAEIVIKNIENEEDIKKKALSDQIVSKFTAGKEIKKIIYVKNRLVSIVV
ncbi:MAG: class I tRNA ligase family protein [Patescibacteria group bacterium]